MAFASALRSAAVRLKVSSQFPPSPLRQGNIMDQKTYEKGLKVRTAVLGEEYVNKSIQGADEFNKPFQELVTEYCWGAVWGRETLPLKTRSMLNLVMIA